MDGTSSHRARKHLRLFAMLLVGASAVWPATLAARTSGAPLMLEAKVALGEVGYRRLARMPMVSGARTSLFVPELDRFFVRSGKPAAIWVLRPFP